MSYFKPGIGSESINLAKAVLLFSLLGILIKLLDLQIEQISIVGISVKSGASQLIPGIVGICLIYVFIALCVARFEITLESRLHRDEEKAVVQKLTSSHSTVFGLVVLFPVLAITYWFPFIIGVITIILLFGDSVVVVGLIWEQLWKQA
ncbi:hypothetical protein QVK65_004823 [Vibrio alginolyticus]|nr:hypothetical protein [Vibrio alginolyticus]